MLRLKQNNFLKLRPVHSNDMQNTKHHKEMLKVTTKKRQITLKEMTVILSADTSATIGYRKQWKYLQSIRGL